MAPASPRLQLGTLFVLDDLGRIVSTREPRPSRGPRFTLIRGATECAWAVRADVPGDVARTLADLAIQEQPPTDWHCTPKYAHEYQAALGGPTSWWGPAFEFPEPVPSPCDAEEIHDESLLACYFTGWSVGEFASGASPVLAAFEGGVPVSVCFCARRSGNAAEAGVDTASAYRRRGYALRVVPSWAAAVRASGRTPLYSTSWENTASLGLAKRLGLRIYATDWSVA